MTAQKFDAIIIGTGQSGPSLAVRLAATGLKVAIIERKNFGGTCVNTGCIPTKTLVASAEVAHLVQRANEFGIDINGTIKTNWKNVKARKDAIVHKASQGVEQWLKNTPNVTVFHDHAKFVNNYTIAANNQHLTAEKIFINVGARAFIPPMKGINEINYLTNSSLLDLEALPEHLIVIGGSYIGLEFAQAFRFFGSKVTVIEKAPRLIPREDEDVSETVLAIMKAAGIDVHLNTNCLEFSKSGEEVVAHVGCDNNKKTIQGSHVLMAIGRKPNTDDLGIENTDIKLDNRGMVEVDDYLATSVKNIWAIGECNGRGAFTHTSYNDYQIVADNLLHHTQRKVTDRIMAYALYIDPPLGRCGMTEAEIRQAGLKALVAKRPMTQVKRAVIKGEPTGFIKVLVDENSQKILGATILGVGGDEIIHSILDVMYADKPYTLIRDAVHIHPTVSELIPTTLEQLQPLK
ncbi:FAD-containing oxidoreductase [Legionella micdadei]|uniref:Dihydrolipoamide dehydrogenase (E3) n=1 Tax=Legionella micdadei TaxID=451 RepID=A0A098GEG9_LEGMI|nr:FAD-containing oxidoreductase [Legionella micdadei]ARG97567.1 mercuric reductase [Legionella micdadei]ARH00120.1 mercuric reductase [Legionella micdadei]KTD27645.1 pyridine nucleotide-disulfide oxidoreductase [Legionella micdadei]NSL17629.1 FAD-containing oxidoreductase [Legionella micdadei]CEG60869.1 Dihydrolipoamide dehydrogenase (E3) [Legionella micdadei]